MERTSYRYHGSIVNLILYTHSWLRGTLTTDLCEDTITTTLCGVRTGCVFTRSYWNFIEGLICGNTCLP